MIRSHRALQVLLCLSLVAGTPHPSGLAFSADSQPAKHVAAQAQQGSVDVNTASEDELVAVPGIGKSIARRIVEFRDKNGPYQRVEDLMKVQGIGEKNFQKLRPYLTVGKAR